MMIIRAKIAAFMFLLYIWHAMGRDIFSLLQKEKNSYKEVLTDKIYS